MVQFETCDLTSRRDISLESAPKPYISHSQFDSAAKLRGEMKRMISKEPYASEGKAKAKERKPLRKKQKRAIKFERKQRKKPQKRKKQKRKKTQKRNRGRERN